MMMLTDRQAQTRTDAEDFSGESYPIPIVGLMIVGLFLGDIAVVVAAMSAMG